MYAPYPENMMESIKKVEATRAERMATEPRRLSADEKDALLKKFHPDYNPDAFAEIKVGPNKGQKAPLELTRMLHSESRLMNENIDLTKIDYDVDVHRWRRCRILLRDRGSQRRCQCYDRYKASYR